MSYTVNVNNRVKVPKEVCEHLGIEPGDEVDFEPLADGSVRMIAVPTKPGDDNRFVK